MYIYWFPFLESIKILIRMEQQSVNTPYFDYKLFENTLLSSHPLEPLTYPIFFNQNQSIYGYPKNPSDHPSIYAFLHTTKFMASYNKLLDATEAHQLQIQRRKVGDDHTPIKNAENIQQQVFTSMDQYDYQKIKQTYEKSRNKLFREENDEDFSNIMHQKYSEQFVDGADTVGLSLARSIKRVREGFRQVQDVLHSKMKAIHKQILKKCPNPEVIPAINWMQGYSTLQNLQNMKKFCSEYQQEQHQKSNLLQKPSSSPTKQQNQNQQIEIEQNSSSTPLNCSNSFQKQNKPPISLPENSTENQFTIAQRRLFIVKSIQKKLHHFKISITESLNINQKVIGCLMELKKKVNTICSDFQDEEKNKPKQEKEKTRECLVCGMIFDDGQRLGGHMSKRHPGVFMDYSKRLAMKNDRIVEDLRRKYFKVIKNPALLQKFQHEINQQLFDEQQKLESNSPENEDSPSDENTQKKTKKIKKIKKQRKTAPRKTSKRSSEMSSQLIREFSAIQEQDQQIYSSENEFAVGQ